MVLTVLILVVGAVLFVSPLLLAAFLSLKADSPQRRRTALPTDYSPVVGRPRPERIPGRCSDCGADNDSDYEFCRECGSRLDADTFDGTDSLERSFGTE